MPRTKAIVGIEEIAGLRSARQQSPFFTMVIRDEWLVSFDYAIVIHSIHSMLKNSIHSIQKLMNGPSVFYERIFYRIVVYRTNEYSTILSLLISDVTNLYT